MTVRKLNAPTTQRQHNVLYSVQKIHSKTTKQFRYQEIFNGKYYGINANNLFVLFYFIFLSYSLSSYGLSSFSVLFCKLIYILDTLINK